jgi:putative ABC transport system permease protein
MSVRALAEQGYSTFAVPVVQVTIGVVGAAVAGMLAAILPARRAARVDILEAVAAS